MDDRPLARLYVWYASDLEEQLRERLFGSQAPAVDGAVGIPASGSAALCRTVADRVVCYW
jgi:hypothetical protein